MPYRLPPERFRWHNNHLPGAIRLGYCEKMDTKPATASRFIGLLLLSILLLGVGNPSAQALSRFKQPGVPTDLQITEGAILEENDTFFTVMTDLSVRSLAKSTAEILSRDPEGDRAFVNKNRSRNGDYWYWAHRKSRDALVLALGNQPEEAARVIESIPYTDALVPQYRWIPSLEFKEYLENAKTDLGYRYDPYVGVEVFLTNYQVAGLDREYPNLEIRGRVIKQRIPMLNIVLKDLVATPRAGEETKVGLDAILDLPGGGITKSLLPGEEEYEKREVPYQEKMIVANDATLKGIPVSSKQTKELFEKLMSDDPQYNQFLRIEVAVKGAGSTGISQKGTTFAEGLKVVVNPDSYPARIDQIYYDIFKSAKLKKAQ